MVLKNRNTNCYKMKKFFLIAATLFFMASCGSSETSETPTVDTTFGSEVPPDMIDNDESFSAGEYQGSGNEADADESAAKSSSDETIDDGASENTKGKDKKSKEKSKDEEKNAANSGGEKTKAAGSASKEGSQEMFD